MINISLFLMAPGKRHSCLCLGWSFSSTYKWDHRVFVFLSGLFHVAQYSQSSPVLMQMVRCSSFSRMKLHTHIHFAHLFKFFVHSSLDGPSLDGTLGYFHMLAVVNYVEVIVEYRYLFKNIILSPWYTPKSGVAGSYSNSFNFWGTPCTVFHNDYNQQYTNFPFFYIPLNTC